MAETAQMFIPIDPEIRVLVARHGDDPEAILEIFQDLQKRHGGLTREAIEDVARALCIPRERAYGVASFYSMIDLEPGSEKVVRVCDGPVCWLRRASEVREAAEKLFGESEEYRVERTSCLGLCDHAPALLFGDEQAGPVHPNEVKDLPEGYRGTRQDYSNPLPGEVRVMMKDIDKVDPLSLESAIEHGAYEALEKALQMQPEDVIAEISESGLQGRGGAGFPVGRKWGFVAQAQGSPKYVVCNADESEPLIFKDRVMMESKPHQLLEGMAIAGYATGAQEAFIYIRGEYEPQAEILEQAIHQAEEAGWLGDAIQGTDFSFHIHVHRGAGAYICGEETALIESLEGKRGEPRLRPPYPPSYGYQGKPTLVNNVETLSAVPAILLHGADWWKSLSDFRTPGTKVYMVLGHVQRPTLFEAPFGLTLRQIIDEFGGGMLPGSKFQFALSGGAAGLIVPPDYLDVPIDYRSASEGVSLGAGSFLVCDQTVSPVAFLREVMHFFSVETCGKCTPCRIGTYQSVELLDRLSRGQGKPRDLEDLYNIAGVAQVASFCGLGQSIAMPVHSALRHFQDAFTRSIGSGSAMSGDEHK